jgi:hypothetical protein
MGSACSDERPGMEEWGVQYSRQCMSWRAKRPKTIPISKRWKGEGGKEEKQSRLGPTALPDSIGAIDRAG